MWCAGDYCFSSSPRYRGVVKLNCRLVIRKERCLSTKLSGNVRDDLQTFYSLARISLGELSQTSLTELRFLVSLDQRRGFLALVASYSFCLLSNKAASSPLWHLALFWCDISNSTVVMLFVVSPHEFMHPFASLFNTLEGASRIGRVVFQGAEQTFRVEVIVTDRGQTE